MIIYIHTVNTVYLVEGVLVKVMREKLRDCSDEQVLPPAGQLWILFCLRCFRIQLLSNELNSDDI